MLVRTTVVVYLSTDLNLRNSNHISSSLRNSITQYEKFKYKKIDYEKIVYEKLKYEKLKNEKLKNEKHKFEKLEYEIIKYEKHAQEKFKPLKLKNEKLEFERLKAEELDIRNSYKKIRNSDLSCFWNRRSLFVLHIRWRIAYFKTNARVRQG